MKIDQDKLPNNLDEAVQMLMDSLEPEERKELDKQLARQDDVVAGVHFGLGMWLRNNWNLWDESFLSRWFVKTLKISHADDLSGIILEAFLARYQGQPYDPAPTVARYHKHWLKHGDTPEMMIADWMRHHKIKEL